MKNNYFYKKPLSNIYRKPNVVSEVTSQILYGEKFKIISKNKGWLKIKVLFDNYTGYIKNKDYTKNHKPTHKIFALKANIYSKQKKKMAETWGGAFWRPVTGKSQTFHPSYRRLLPYKPSDLRW